MLIENPYYHVQGLKKEEVLAEIKNLPAWDKEEIIEKMIKDDADFIKYLMKFIERELQD